MNVSYIGQFFIRMTHREFWVKSLFLIEWIKYSQTGEGKQMKEGLCISIRGSQSMIVNLNKTRNFAKSEKQSFVDQININLYVKFDNGINLVWVRD